MGVDDGVVDIVGPRQVQAPLQHACSLPIARFTRRHDGRRIEAAPARRHIAVRPDQIGRAGPRIVALSRPVLRPRREPTSCRRAPFPRAEGQNREIAAQTIDQPIVPERRIDHRPSRSGAPLPVRVLVRRVERRAGLDRRHRQPPAVDQRACERKVARQRERGVAEDARGREPGRDEVGRAGRVQDIFARGGAALAAIGVEQAGRCLAFQNQRELPGEIVGIGHGRVAAARAERRDDVRGIAGEDRPAMDEPLHHAAGEGVDAGPLVLPAGVGTEDLAQPPVDILRLLLFLGIGVAAELEIDPQHVVGLAVQQHRVGRMERRIEPEAPLLRQLALVADVGDQELVVEHLARIRQARACGAPGCARRRRRPATRRRACSFHPASRPRP